MASEIENYVVAWFVIDVVNGRWKGQGIERMERVGGPAFYRVYLQNRQGANPGTGVVDGDGLYYRVGADNGLGEATALMSMANTGVRQIVFAASAGAVADILFIRGLVFTGPTANLINQGLS